MEFKTRKELLRLELERVDKSIKTVNANLLKWNDALTKKTTKGVLGFIFIKDSIQGISNNIEFFGNLKKILEDYREILYNKINSYKS